MMTYRMGGLLRKGPSHEDLLTDHYDLVLSRAAADTIEEFDLHFGGSLEGVDDFLRQPMSFSVVVAAVSPALAPEIGFVDDFRPSSRDRVRILEKVCQAMTEMYPDDEDRWATMTGPSKGENDTNTKKLAHAMLDLAHGVSSAREARLLSVDDLALRAGVEALDIEMLEEGDVSDASLLLRVIDALGADVHLEGGFRVSVDTKVAA